MSDIPPINSQIEPVQPPFQPLSQPNFLPDTLYVNEAELAQKMIITFTLQNVVHNIMNGLKNQKPLFNSQ